MTADSPAVLLRAAAGKVRERAEAATCDRCGEWQRGPESVVVSARADDDMREVLTVNVGPHDEEIAAWIALADPDFGQLLADWLDKFADLYEASTHRNRPVFGDLDAALSLARLIVGSEQ